MSEQGAASAEQGADGRRFAPSLGRRFSDGSGYCFGLCILAFTTSVVLGSCLLIFPVVSLIEYLLKREARQGRA